MRKLFLQSFEGYRLRRLRSDIYAALVVTAIAVPESLGFAAIVGLPLQAGLYTALFAPIVFAIFASTKRLVVGADSATAALVASGAGLVAVSGHGFTNAVAVLGLLTALILVLMALAKVGFLADLISRPVLVGFLAGVGIQLIVNKFPELLGVDAHGSMLDRLAMLLQQLGHINGMTLTISVLVVGTIVLTHRTRVPGELLGIVLAAVFAFAFHVGDYGVKLVGALPSGIPLPAMPEITLGMLVTLLPAAFSIAIVILAQSSAVIRSSAGEHDDKVRLNHDLLALGLANATSALTRGFALNGSPPRTLAADLAGARSQFVNIFMSIFIGTLLLFGGSLFEHMPTAALAAVVCVIGFRLIRWRELDYLWTTHRAEFFVALVALVGTALFGVRQGVLIAVVVSLMERLSRQYRPKDQVLLRDGELSEWARERVGEHSRHDAHPHGLLVYSFDGALFFENVTYFVSRLKRAINMAKEPVTYVVVDAGAIDSIDYTAVETMKQLYRQLSMDNIKLGFAHVSPNLRRQFDDFGMTDLIGTDNIFTTLSGAIKSRPGNRRSAIEMVQHLGLKPGTYVVIGGAVLEALNLRDTNDVDIVVSDDVYAYYRDKKHWSEYVQDNGKKILSHDGYNLMHTWMSHNLKRLKKHSFVVEDVAFMGVEDLIEAKRRLGRRKDVSDITLLEQYAQRHPSSQA